jgi:hypothetical protein
MFYPPPLRFRLRPRRIIQGIRLRLDWRVHRLLDCVHALLGIGFGFLAHARFNRRDVVVIGIDGSNTGVEASLPCGLAFFGGFGCGYFLSISNLMSVLIVMDRRQNASTSSALAFCLPLGWVWSAASFSVTVVASIPSELPKSA